MATSLVSTGVQFPDSSVQTTAASAGGISYQAFTSSGTFTIPAGVTKVKVTLVGGGGGTYGTTGVPDDGGSSSISSGTQTITTVTAGGGGKGLNGTTGGTGGTGVNGDVNIPGGNGGYGHSGSSSSGPYSSGAGGNSLFGQGGISIAAAYGSVAISSIAGKNYGGGASGRLYVTTGGCPPNQYTAYPGAGGGATVFKWLTGLTPGNTITVTVGGGGVAGSGTTNQLGAAGAPGIVIFEW